MWNVILPTLSISLIEHFPLIYTRQPVEASTRFSELPLGPRSRPTKLNYKYRRFSTTASGKHFQLFINSKQTKTAS